MLGDDVFGVDLARIKEILSLPPITLVPRAPASIVGVCSVRGLLVSVMDLRIRLRLEARARTRRARILLVTTDSGEVVGLLVDEVRHVVRLSEDELWSLLRQEGLDEADLSDLERVQLETDGKLSVLRKSTAEPAQRRDLRGSERRPA